MTKRLYLHVGAPKSGTTYLQAVLRHNTTELGKRGVLVAGKTHLDLVHAGFVVREDRRLEHLPPRASAAWERLVRQVRSFDGETAVMSYELFAGATRRQAERALTAFSGLEVHVVVTTRDLGRAVSSAWQERLKFALTTPLEEWQPRPVTSAPRADWGWGTLDPSGIAARWGATLPSEHVHIVTAPRGRSQPTALWDRFAEACGLSEIRIDLDVPVVNESLGVRAAEVLRRVNSEDLGPVRGPREQSRWLRDALAHAVLAGLDDEPMAITDAQLADARARAEEAVATIRSSGWQVHGDLGDLSATRKVARLPSEIPAEELLDVATKAMVGLLLELREVTLTRGRRGAGVSEAAPGGWRARIPDVTGRRIEARLADLERRLADSHREVQRARRLHERVAALTDVVAELLLPAAQQNRKVVRKALRRYRRQSL